MEGHKFQVGLTQPAQRSVDEAEHMAQFNQQITCETRRNEGLTRNEWLRIQILVPEYENESGTFGKVR
jgi:hypothetical protein